MTDISIEVVLGILFFTLSNANIGFLDMELTWRTYNIAQASSTTKKIQIIDRKEFTKAILDPDK